jgi:hypothetical protein
VTQDRIPANIAQYPNKKCFLDQAPGTRVHWRLAHATTAFQRHCFTATALLHPLQVEPDALNHTRKARFMDERVSVWSCNKMGYGVCREVSSAV